MLMSKLSMSFLLGLITIDATFSQPSLPTDETSLFSGSGNCAMCHTAGTSVLSEDGRDISPVTLWSSSMMANSSTDPLWRAVVAEEVAEFPQHTQLIETTCMKCHSPMGYTQAIRDGKACYAMRELRQDALANDGVSCTLCHQINSSNLDSSTSYSGGYRIGDDRKIFGPYEEPFSMPMRRMGDYTPTHSPHVHTSEVCGTCHTLITPTLDAKGTIVGQFPEQSTYLEWKNSIYPKQGIGCQSCHMPITDTPIDIALRPPWHRELRTPFWKHTFVGANIYMLNLLSANSRTLGITTRKQDFDSTIARTRESLMSQSLRLSLESSVMNDSLVVFVKLENLTGHKLPTGIPLRRMWIHLTIKDQSGKVLFESGKWNAKGEIVGERGIEPHHDVITASHQVQVYEGIFQNDRGNRSHTLLKALSFKKDNRIPPKGFVATHVDYNQMSIQGEAATDSDFNMSNGVEGTGGDIVTYKTPAAANSHYSIGVDICYQTISPTNAEHLFEFRSLDIQRFASLYKKSDRKPTILKTMLLNVVANK